MDPTYSEDEAEAILKRAVSAKGERVSRDRLEHMARELGVSEAELRQAEIQVRTERLQAEELRAFRAHSRQEFVAHLTVYLAVNVGLFVMDYMGDRQIDWAFWPVLGWGIAVAIHLGTFLFPSTSESKKEFEKWKQTQVENLGPQVRRTLDDLAVQEVGALDAVDRLQQQLGLTTTEAKLAVDAYNAENGNVFSQLRS